MKLLLTSSGITNTSIEDALVELLGKPIAESDALCIPTGIQPFPGGPSHVYQFITATNSGPMCGLGWKSLGVLELTALPSIKDEYWMSAVRETDALLVWGGSPMYLCYWMRQSGLADLLPSLRSGWSTSRCSHISIARTAFRLHLRKKSKHGPPDYPCRPT